MEEILTLAQKVVEILEEKKGEDIILLDLQEVASFTDYFVICSGPSERTLKALASEVQKRLKQEDHRHAMSVEGDPEGGWILVDFGDVILHIFSPAVRSYYQLEDLWREGQILLRIQ
ncbi:MAG: ribosome silencing factor [Anaerolineales bacterium]|nr:MAG: ribosome silencing factor [Anaerolineales bacterium]